MTGACPISLPSTVINRSIVPALDPLPPAHFCAEFDSVEVEPILAACEIAAETRARFSLAGSKRKVGGRQIEHEGYGLDSTAALCLALLSEYVPSQREALRARIMDR